MLTMNLSTLTKPELPDFPVGLLSTPPTAAATKTTAPARTLPNPTPKDDNLTALVEALRNVEQLCCEARRLADSTQEQQLDYRRRAEQAEADKTHLEHEMNRLRAELEALEQRVPRWVRRIFGAIKT